MLRRSLVLIGSLFLLSCATQEGAESYPFEWTVWIAPHPDSVLTSTSVQLHAGVVDAAGNPNSTAPLVWLSRDSSVATIGSDGTLTARAPGRVRIIAQALAFADSTAITVIPFASGIVIASRPDSIPNHTTIHLGASVVDGAGRPNPLAIIDWASSDSTIATVTPSGELTARARGTAWIRARSSGFTDSILVRVTPVLAKLVITPADTTVAPEGAVRFEATLFDSDGLPVTGVPITWSSTDTLTASIDSTGTATPRVLDSTLIRASANGIAGTAVVRAGGRFRWISIVGRYGVCAGVVGGGTYCGGDPWWTGWGRECTEIAYADCQWFAPMPVSLDTADGAIGSDAFYALNWCVLRPGRALCWGGVGDGIMVPGSTSDIRTVHEVPGLPALDTLALGATHACGISAGAVLCWGDGAYGAIGDSTCMHTGCGPHVVEGLSATALGASRARTCAALTTGRVACWGKGFDNDPGTSQWISSATPVELDSVTNAVAIAMNDATACALSGTGEVWCWGSSYVGELGNGVPYGNTDLTPRRVNGVPPLRAIAAGDRQYCGLDAGGDAWCWGLAGLSSWPGPFIGAVACHDGYTDGYCRFTPANVAPEHRFLTLSLGGLGVCGLATDGIAYCWGDRGLSGRNGEWGTGSAVVVRAGGQAP